MYLTTPAPLIKLISRYGITLWTLVGGVLGVLVCLVFLKMFGERKLKSKSRMWISACFFFPSCLLAISGMDVLLNGSLLSYNSSGDNMHEGKGQGTQGTVQTLDDGSSAILIIYNICFWTVSILGW